jgi:hypothetical protein
MIRLGRVLATMNADMVPKPFSCCEKSCMSFTPEPTADIPNIASKVDLISGGTKRWLWRLAFTLLYFDKLTVPDDLEAFEMPRRGRLVLATDLGAGRLRLRRNSDSS